MIGKIYRPTKIVSLPGKRGFRLHHKYKSNFTGLYHFQKDVYLHYQDGGESIRIEFHDLNIPVVLDGEHFNIITKNYAVSKQEKKTVSLEHFNTSALLRKIQRPANQQMSSKNMLTIIMSILSADPDGEETLLLRMKPIILNNDEFLWFFASAKTQVEVLTNSTITYSNE